MSALRILLPIFVSLVVVVSGFAQCPSIVVHGPAGITWAGDEVNFQAEVGVVGPPLTYRWMVSAGTIVKGQGTSSITVASDKSVQERIIATVEVGGLPSACQKTASETAAIVAMGCGLIEDEWGALKPNDVRMRLDNFFADLSNNPTHTGIVMLIVTAEEPMDLTNKRLQLILRHIAFRKFKRDRIWFQFELGDDVRTKVHRLLPGGELLCEKCLTIKGADIP